jgi:acetoin utilization deacetylase AcuC-like enzyme
MRKRVGLVYDDAFLRHVPPDRHPEGPERLTSIVDSLKREKLWDKLEHVAPEQVTDSELHLIHSSSYVSEVEAACATGVHRLDADTYVAAESYAVARLAAGAVTTAIRRLIEGKLDSAFCAVRPPGHHAERDRAMGFCLFNNVAIGAATARAHLGLEKVAILDWDVHHGNGTQNSFLSDNSVHYTSIHQYPHYPGSGAAAEKGAGNGLGYTMNFPLPAGAGDEEYLSALEVFWIPEMEKFKPNLILVSAGFDAHLDDPLSAISLSEKCFAEMTRMVLRCADRCCSGRVISVLEGGYDLPALGRSVAAHVRELLK